MALTEMRKMSDDPTELTSPTGDGGSKGFQSLRLLASLADKALAMGRSEEAERILPTVLIDILSRARTNVPLEMPAAELAARYAARLAAPRPRGRGSTTRSSSSRSRAARCPAPSSTSSTPSSGASRRSISSRSGSTSTTCAGWLRRSVRPSGS